MNAICVFDKTRYLQQLDQRERERGFTCLPSNYKLFERRISLTRLLEKVPGTMLSNKLDGHHSRVSN